MKKHPYEFPYCLHCYAPLALPLATESHGLGELATARKNARASVTCPHCENINLAVDTKRHWTREAKIVELEWWLKAAVVVFIGFMSFSILMSRQTGLSAAGHGMVVGAPILLAIVLWDLASITQKRGLFNGAILWSCIAAFIGLPITLIVSAPGVGAHPAAQLFVGLCATVGLVLPFLLQGRWEAWREARIARFQAALLAS